MAKLDPRIISVWRWTIAFWGLIAVVGAGLAAWLLLQEWGWRAPVAVGVLAAGAGGLLAWFAPAAMWSHWHYELANDALVLDHGVYFRENSVIPWSRVQHVDVSHGPLDRRYGLAQLKIHTASAKTDAKLPGLEAAEAERLRLDILERYRRATTAT